MVNIRMAVPEDIEFIAQSQLSMAMETEQLQLDSPTVAAGVKAVLTNADRGFYIIATLNHEPAGCLMITPEWSDWRNAWVWWIQSVFVKPDMRQAGVFGAMYSFIKEQVMQRNDVAGIRLYVDNTNQRARGVYARVGMSDQHYRTFEWMK
ncbi:MAG: GNAT family N-acetyltransferase [Lentimicrobiaceae bacterium]|nr:GNAT family N-acetyltransferase [Lentimicrobiaceae bacterium]